MPKYPAVRVDWVDSAFTQGWQRSWAKVRTSECSTIGYLIEKTKEQVVVAMGINEDGGYGEALAIPRANVRKVRKLRAR